MKHKGYNELDVLRDLHKKHDLRVFLETRQIVMLYGSSVRGDIGIKTKGKIDFLINYQGYKKSWTDRLK